MEESGDSLSGKLKPILKQNGTFENPFQSWKGLPSGGSMCRFMRERMVAKWRGTDKIPSQVS